MSIFNKDKKTDSSAKSIKMEKGSGAKDFKKNKLSKDKTSAVIIEPVITEKSSFESQFNKYLFKVANSANKSEVKKAIEGFYNVNVTDVNIIKTAPKPRRVGRMIGQKPGFKKAIVTLKKGESIEAVKS